MNYQNNYMDSRHFDDQDQQKGYPKPSMYRNVDDDKNNVDPMRHSANVERTIMERGMMFNMDTRNDRYHKQSDYGKYQESNNFGEITGRVYDPSVIDQGMPLRGFLDKPIERIPDIEEQQHAYNPHLDFDLYRSRPQLNVSYYDPTSTGPPTNTHFSDINNNSQLLHPTQKIDPIKQISTISNLFSCSLLDRFNNLPNKKNVLVVSPFSILAPLMLLFRGSHSGTELEIQTVLGLPKKDVSFDSFTYLCNKIFTSSNIVGTSAIFLPNTFPLNQAFIDFSSGLGKIIQYDKSRPSQEIFKINSIVEDFSKGTVKGIAKSNLINMDTSIILITTTFFRGVWKIPFDKNSNKVVSFNTKTSKRKVQMMIHKHTLHNYYEDTMNQILELDYADDEFSFGVILPKQGNKLSVSHEQFEYYVSQLTPVHTHIVSIPKFKQQSKFKIDNLFKKIGLKEVFTNADLSEITPSNSILYVSDIIHQSAIVIDEGETNNNNYPRPDTTPTKKINFIANHPFMYYIRFKPTNTIVMIGYYD